MAVNYNPPPWLRGASPLEAVVPGASLGLRIAESNQRAAFEFMAMQNQQQRFAQQMEMEQQQLQQQQAFQEQKLQAQQKIAEQEQLRDDQKLQIENSYRQGQLGLQKQKLELTSQAAAQKFQAQQQFLSQREMLKSGFIYEEGMDPAEAEQKATIQALFILGPQMGMSPNALAQLAISAGSKPEASLVDMPGGGQVIRQPSGTFTPWQRPEKDVPAPKFQVHPGSAGRPGRITGVTGVSPDQLAQFGITNRYNFGKKKAAPPAQEPEVLPMPSTKDGLVKGKTYNTARGIASWDGERFTPVSPKVTPESVSASLNRPAVTLPNGQRATVRSIGVGDSRGEWVIPTIVNGELVSNDIAIKLWRQGKNQPLGGPFKSIDEANKFGQRLHEVEAKRIGVSDQALSDLDPEDNEE